ncbi:MAG: nucleotidyltransferase domain-containing protein [Nanoarchaeota archaeon]
MELISYAIDFTSFFMQNIKDMSQIKSIILFGSTARGEEDKTSDVDIFIDVLNNEDLEKPLKSSKSFENPRITQKLEGYSKLSNENKIEKESKKIVDLFFDSVKFKDYWKLFGVENEINLVIGNLNKWKLKDTMLGNAIVLYQRFAPKLENGKSRIILSWEKTKPESKRVFLNKKIFGYNYYGKRYHGIIEKYKGKKLGHGVIVFDAEYLKFFLDVFYGFKIPVKIMRIFEYE